MPFLLTTTQPPQKKHLPSTNNNNNKPPNSTKPTSWVTKLTSSLTLAQNDDSNISIASAQLEDVSELLGGALFLPLFKWRLAAGPWNFVIVSDPAIAKHVLKNYGKYSKGLVAMAEGKAKGCGSISSQEVLVCRCAERMVEKLLPDAISGSAVNMEAKFSQLTLDVIGLALFNYNFDSLTTDSPVIDPVYTALKEAKLRSTDLLPYWQADQSFIEIVESEGERINEDDYVNDKDPSILRFLLASREEDPSSFKKAHEEVDRVLGGRSPIHEDMKNLKLLTRCITESLRLYPHPPVLIRRALTADVLPGNYKVNAGQDIMTSVYNVHHSSEVWERAEEFDPERFDLEGPVPNETNTDFRFIPFSGG
ncbi:hypothetical protein RND71_004016 [Anisodus tanguticus]|uniref:Cytochrome P450 n=1 Tax=Anisodus tanguticus TaxID=243964 RepID=A0AAE1SXR7_9SOLA|nr:hypothetical protein RND71_004016 [Anisodus tanguticus]